MSKPVTIDQRLEAIEADLSLLALRVRSLEGRMTVAAFIGAGVASAIARFIEAWT